MPPSSVPTSRQQFRTRVIPASPPTLPLCIPDNNHPQVLGLAVVTLTRTSHTHSNGHNLSPALVGRHHCTVSLHGRASEWNGLPEFSLTRATKPLRPPKHIFPTPVPQFGREGSAHVYSIFAQLCGACTWISYRYHPRSLTNPIMSTPDRPRSSTRYDHRQTAFFISVEKNEVSST